MDEREEAIRAKAAAILSRQPTAEDIAEQEARRRRIAADRAMRGSTDLAELNRRWAIGDPLTDEEFQTMSRGNAEAKHETRQPAPAPAAPVFATRKFVENSFDKLEEAIGVYVFLFRKADLDLEARIAALETSAKPRHRVKAPSRAMA